MGGWLPYNIKGGSEPWKTFWIGAYIKHSGNLHVPSFQIMYMTSMWFRMYTCPFDFNAPNLKLTFFNMKLKLLHAYCHPFPKGAHFLNFLLTATFLRYCSRKLNLKNRWNWADDWHQFISEPGLLLMVVGSTSCSLVQAVITVSVGSRRLTADDPVWCQPLSHSCQAEAEARGNNCRALHTEGGQHAVIFVCICIKDISWRTFLDIRISVISLLCRTSWKYSISVVFKFSLIRSILVALWWKGTYHVTGTSWVWIWHVLHVVPLKYSQPLQSQYLKLTCQ